MSTSLHSEAFNAIGASDGVIHSRMSHEVVSLRGTANNDLKAGMEEVSFFLLPSMKVSVSLCKQDLPHVPLGIKQKLSASSISNDIGSTRS